MQISETRIKLVGSRNDRLKAFCSVTFDNDFVVRDLKIIEGTNGYFVAMPSRKLTDRCPSCGNKNHLKARYCNECGKQLAENRTTGQMGRNTKLHADIAHPVNTETRQFIQARVVEAFKQELEHAKSPDYKPNRYDDDDDAYFPEAPDTTEQTSAPADSPQDDDAPNADDPNADAPTESNEEKSDFDEGIFP